MPPTPAERGHNRGRCTDCRRKLPVDDPRSGGTCAGCKRLNARLFTLHHGNESCEADGEAKRFKVEFYAAVVACGGCIFE